jgi:general stress protein CsbA
LSYFLLGWIPFLIAHLIWKGEEEVSLKEDVVKEKDSSLFTKMRASLKSGWWNQSYNRERVMRESRDLLLLIAFFHLIYGLATYMGTKIEEEKLIYSAVALSFSLLCLLGSIFESFWFRFVLISLWLIDLSLGLVFFSSNENIFLTVFFLIIGIIFLSKMWKNRKAGL